MPIQTAADSISNSAGSPYGFKNRIINGAMVIDQRNAGASITQTTSNQFSVDRFIVVGTVASKFTAQQNAGAVTPPTGFINYLGITSSSAYTVGAAENFNIRYYNEGLNTADLGWGTASAATVTLSFWVRSSLTGTFGGSFNNYAFNRSYPYTFTINAANTWEQKTVTVAGDTSGTWLTTNSGSICIFWNLGCGATNSGTAGAWSANTLIAPTGATSVVGTNGATFYITGVQLEKGTQATAFDYRPFGTELQLCERYYEVSGRAIDSATWAFYSMAAVISQSTGYVCGKQFATQKRTAPTVTIYSRNGTINGISSFNTGADVAGTWVINANGAQGFHAVQGGTVTKGDGYEYGYTASAEL